MSWVYISNWQNCKENVKNMLLCPLRAKNDHFEGSHRKFFYSLHVQLTTLRVFGYAVGTRIHHSWLYGPGFLIVGAGIEDQSDHIFPFFSWSTMGSSKLKFCIMTVGHILKYIQNYVSLLKYGLKTVKRCQTEEKWSS